MSEGANHLFSVALDFGTTYSGFAYSSTSDFNNRPDKIYANEAWNAGGQGLISHKTPTVLLLTARKKFEAFGYEAENLYADLVLENLHKDRYYFRRYKMKLHGDKRIKENTMIHDESGKRAPALLVFSLSIKYLRDKFFEILHKQGLEVNDHEIMWTLTVPAIWCESAKSFMRKAAVEAGICTEQLKLALEPEAASLLCQYIPVEKTNTGISVADIGARYMVIDLGGGTADITVHEKLHGGKLKEIHNASGGPWGGTAVDEGFIKLLTRVVGGPVINKFRKEFTADFLEMMREFEVSKRTIDPNTNISFKLRVPPSLSTVCKTETDEDLKALITAENNPLSGKFKVIGDKLVIDRSLMIEIFEKIERKITRHVKEILQLPGIQDIKFILLVGGFAESPMVQHFLKRKLEAESRRVLVPPQPGLSVVKGAVIFGHQPSSIESRILRFTYGYSANVRFDSKKHPESKKMVYENGEIRCNDVFCSFVTAGASVKTGDIVRETLRLVDRENGEVTVYYTNASDVMFTDDSRLQKLFKVNLRDILPEDAENEQQTVKQKLKVKSIFQKLDLKEKCRTNSNLSSIFRSIFRENKSRL